MSRRVVLLALLALLAVPAAGRAALPNGWLGVMADGELVEQPKVLDPELARAAGTGITTIRSGLWWSLTERCATCKPDWSRFDRVVLAAAQNGISVLPVVLSAPGYLAEDPKTFVGLPKDPEDLGAFMKLAVARYGPDGTFWKAHPKVTPLPIHTWQIWNEPDHQLYMPGTGDHWPERYVALLKSAYAAVHGADPDGRVMLAGLTGTSWIGLDWVYGAGGGPYFDEVALHPYTLKVDNVLQIIRNVRATQRRWGQLDKPVVLTEVGWTGAQGVLRHIPSWCSFCLSEDKAASSLGAVLPKLAAQRKQLDITGIYIYTWLSAYRQSDPFDYAGLRMYQGGKVVSTPSYFAFLRAVPKLK